jgi:hypothetical protein
MTPRARQQRLDNLVKARASGMVKVWRCHDESIVIRQLIRQWAAEPEAKLSARPGSQAWGAIPLGAEGAQRLRWQWAKRCWAAFHAVAMGARKSSLVLAAPVGRADQPSSGLCL